MATAHSRLTAQGQISVPAEIRRRLGLGPGAVLEWHEEDGRIVVRRSGQYSCADIHQVLFGDNPVRRHASKDDGIRTYMRRRHARR